jgi:CheY-like chemotaxis protein
VCASSSSGLREAGTTGVAADGLQAIQVATTLRALFDVVVTDVMMPQMTGDEQARPAACVRTHC